MRKQVTEQTDYLQKATPILQWYQQNYQGIQQMMSQPRQPQGASQPSPYTQPGAAYGHAAGQPANSQAAGAQAALMNLLTPEEQRALAEQVSRQVQETAIALAAAVRQTGPGRDARSGQTGRRRLAESPEVLQRRALEDARTRPST